MKAIKIFVMNLALIGMISGCKNKEQQEHNLDPSTKTYFDIQDGSKFVFADEADTTVTMEYTSGNKMTGRANPDIENSEYLTYDLNAAAEPSFSIRCQSGGTQYKDQIALITRKSGNVYIGPVMFNLGDNFTPGLQSKDSIFKLPTFRVNNTVFTDVVRVKLFGNPLYTDVYFARKLGLIARREILNNKMYYVIRYTLK